MYSRRADLNAQYAAQSTAIQAAQADRTLFRSMGETKADIASSGFGEGGSAGDIRRAIEHYDVPANQHGRLVARRRD
jgi:hypothetical protein